MNNREIKFRAWCEEHKEMMTEENSPEYTFNVSRGYLYFHPHGTFEDEMFRFSSDPNDSDFEQSDYKIIVGMQYTGLKDKNGKEIYEGDIVKTPASKSVVEFNQGTFGLNHDYGTENKTMLGSWGSRANLRGLEDGYYEKIEVIGNIYENPELITASPTQP